MSSLLSRPADPTNPSPSPPTAAATMSSDTSGPRSSLPSPPLLPSDPAPPPPPPTASPSRRAAALTVPAFPCVPQDPELVAILRRWIQGETQPWIHNVSVYSDDPISLTERHPRATAADGDCAWFFVHIPRKMKSGNRFSRTAGVGFWKQERGKSVRAPGQDGSHVTVGRRQTYTFMVNAPGAEPGAQVRVGLGWIMHEVQLMDGEDPDGRCLSMVFPTPRGDSSTPPLPPPAAAATSAAAAAATSGALRSTAAAATLRAAASAASATRRAAAAALLAALQGSAPPALPVATEPVPSLSKEAAPAALSAVLQGLSPPTAAAAVASGSTSAEAAASTAASTAAAATVETVAKDTEAAAAAAEAKKKAEAAAKDAEAEAAAAAKDAEAEAAAAAAAEEEATKKAEAAAPASPTASPPKRWIKLQVSDSPTKLIDRNLPKPKRVYQVVHLPDHEDDAGNSSTKRRKAQDCMGWLTMVPIA